MHVFTGTTRAFAVISLALFTGCGGQATSAAADRGAGDDLANNGGKDAAPNDSGSEAGAVNTAVGGAPGSAGRSDSGNNVGGAAHAGSPGIAGNGSSAAGAAGAIGAAGASGAASASGAGGAPSTTSADVTAACTKLCTNWIHGCSIWEFAPTCPTDCSSDLAVQNGACTDLGLAMLSCLTATSGTTSNNLCYTAFSAGISACRTQVDAFLSCAANGGPAPQPKICMRAGSALSDGCAEVRYCLNSVSSELKCTNAPSGKSSCECWNEDTIAKVNSSTDVTLDEQSGDLCLQHMDECLASGRAP